MENEGAPILHWSVGLVRDDLSEDRTSSLRFKEERKLIP